MEDPKESNIEDPKEKVEEEKVNEDQKEKYREIFLKLKKEIHDFRISEKFGCSSPKHILALLAAKLSPKLYVFLKNDMKLQYR